MMATSAKVKLVATHHRRKLIAGLCLAVVVALALAVGFTLHAIHHHHHDPIPTPTLTLTSFNSTSSPAGSIFSLLFSDPIQGSLQITPEYISSSSSNGSSPTTTILGKPKTFYPDGRRQTVFSGLLPLVDLPPFLLAQQASGTLRQALHVNTLLDGVLRGWFCFTRPVGKCSPISLHS